MSEKQKKEQSMTAGEPLWLTRWNKTADQFKRAFLIVFTVLFGWLFINVLFGNMHYEYYQPAWVIACALVWGGVFVAAFWASRRYAVFLQRREKWVLVGFSVLLLATQLFFYSQLAAYPTRDFERVFTGAVNYAVNGFIEEPYLDYFYKFPNNMPVTIVLQLFFRVGNRIGFRNFYLIGALIGAACIWLTYLFVYLCCRKLWGVGQGVFTLVLLYLCLPLQTYISIFYTDVLALPFIPFAFYSYLCWKDAKTTKGKIAAALCLTLGVAFGAQLKYSVVLILLAICVDMLLHADWKKLAVTAVLFLAGFMLFSAAFTAYMYNSFLEEEGAADMATPFVSWIMMGLKGDGAHNPEDNNMIWVWPTKEEKEAQAWAELKARLGQFTPVSFLRFLNQKSIRSFGSGNLDYPHTVADSPMKQTFLVECVSEGGKYFMVFDTIAQGYHVALFVFIIAGAAAMAKKKEYGVLVPHIATMGHYLFLLLWESGQRYLLHYYGMYILAASTSFWILWKDAKNWQVGQWFLSRRKSAAKEDK